MIRNLFKRQPKETPAQRALAVLAQTRSTAPGTRVHHEYSVSPSAEGYDWLARVYAANGAVNEQAGHAVNESLAREQALAWCAQTSHILKGL